MFFLFVAKCLCLSTPSCPVLGSFSSRLLSILPGLGTDHVKVQSQGKSLEIPGYICTGLAKSAVQLSRRGSFSCQPGKSSAN